tara:strand:- start:295 stop:489 length:195 start_codon:yes stop_codon:yes gene_type:complete
MKVAIIGDKKNTKSLAMELAIKCNIPIVVVAKCTFCVCKGSGGIRMDGTCARCNKPLELADNNA